MHECPLCHYKFEDAESLRRHLEEGRGCPEAFAESLRARLQEYDDTLATPGQAQDIAELDLFCDVRAMVCTSGS